MVVAVDWCFRSSWLLFLLWLSFRSSLFHTCVMNCLIIIHAVRLVLSGVETVVEFCERND